MASRAKEEPRISNIPDIVIDPGTKKRYMKGRFLGKGGFAKCYELTDLDTKEVYAGKVVSKSLLTKPHQKEKMSQEISIHRSLKHEHIVGFHGFFEDTDNVYIVLELCRRRSLMEMHKRRKVLTEPETRYFMRQVIIACKYLHEKAVIHRDLKLGNLFLNDEMEIKLGDFGLATRVDYDGERKKTLCGTPNYIAPEVLSKKGHSFEVDVWSLGCIMYTLLVGKPPFETSCLKDTYTRIKKNEYYVPSRVSSLAKFLIQKLLRSDPSQRPNMEEILCDDFITSGYLPPRLPTSCLTMAPRFDVKNLSAISAPSGVSSRKPLIDLNKDSPNALASKPDLFRKLTAVPEKGDDAEGDILKDHKPSPGDIPADYYLGDLYSNIMSVVSCKPADRLNIQEEEAEDPAAVPFIWISKWVDYTDKYGLGYQLCDNSVGVLFNDSTRLVLLPDGHHIIFIEAANDQAQLAIMEQICECRTYGNIHYIERDGDEHYHNLSNFPDALNKKVTLLKYFRTYMNEHLLKAGESITPREGDELTRLPYLRAWFRTRSAIVFHLTNGTLQVNFFQDHTKIILCPLMGAVSYIDEKKDFHTYRLKLIEKYGCSKMLASRIRYAKTMVERLVATKSGSGKTKSS